MNTNRKEIFSFSEIPQPPKGEPFFKPLRLKISIPHKDNSNLMRLEKN